MSITAELLLALQLAGAAGAALAAGGASMAAEPADAPQVLIRGRIQDERGNPLEGITVTLIRTRKSIDLRRWAWEESEATLDRAPTDSQGFYEIRAEDDGSFSSYFLRLYDPHSFDAVRYATPADRDITRRFRRGRPLVENCVVREHPDWARVREEVARVGEDSARGQVLRRLGLPEKVDKGADPGSEREEWWYYRRGIVYQFERDRVVGERRFEPVPEPPPLGETGR